MKNILGGIGVFIMMTVSVCGQEKVANWVKVTDNAGWPPRDSQGEVVYQDKMWILGGWFDSSKPCPRDVWNTPDGKTWNLVQKTAPWKHSDLPMTLVFKDRMWFMGGWYNGRLPDHAPTNDVWCSTDGVKWEQATPSAGWSPRLAAGAVVFKDKMWILGGSENYLFGDERSLKNDVWYSSDGREWTLATTNAGWAPRAFHQAVVYDNKIWVLGGGNYSPKCHARNDVWCSADGVNWTKVTEAAPWPPRIWFSSVVYRDRLWVLGGGSGKSTPNFGDVWYSKDGKNWTQLKSEVVWKERHEHSTFVFQDKIWVSGGYPPLHNDVWSLYIPADWFGNE